METVFVNTFDEKFKKISSTARNCEVKVIRLRAEDAGKTVGSLAGLKLPEKAAAEQIPLLYTLPEIMLMYGFTGERLERFLDEIKKNVPDGIALKAVITPANALWTLRALAQELEREHSIMAGGNRR